MLIADIKKINTETQLKVYKLLTSVASSRSIDKNVISTNAITLTHAHAHTSTNLQSKRRV